MQQKTIQHQRIDLRQIARRLRTNVHRTLPALRPGGYARIHGSTYTIHLCSFGVLLDGDIEAAKAALHQAQEVQP